MAAGTHERGRSGRRLEARPQEPELREALRAVIDPELGDSVVDLGMVPSITISADGAVVAEVALTIAACPLRNQLEHDVVARLSAMAGVEAVEVRTTEMSADARSAPYAASVGSRRDPARCTRSSTPSIVSRGPTSP